MFDSQQFVIGSSQVTSPTLLERVRLRDAAAWQRFVHLYGPVIFRWAKRARLQDHDAADVSQEVFQSVAEHIDRFRREHPGDSLRGWLWTITRNKVRDHVRRGPREQGIGGDEGLEQMHSLPVSPAEPAHDVSALASELAHRALELIQSEFEAKTWLAFLRCAVEKATPADVAADLGLSVAAVYKAKSRVALRLRHELHGLVE